MKGLLDLRKFFHLHLFDKNPLVLETESNNFLFEDILFEMEKMNICRLSQLLIHLSKL